MLSGVPGGGMHVSLSEVEAAVAKAVMAVGLPAGLGEDAGRAARLMLRSGIGTLSDLVDALDAVDGGASVGFDADGVSAGRLVPVDGAKRLSALRAGPTACDLLLVAAGSAGGDGRAPVTPAAVDTARPRDARGRGSGNVVTLAAVDCPTVVLHEVLDVSRHVDAAFLVAWSTGGGPGIEVLCRGGVASLGNGAPAGASGAGPAEMSIGVVETTPDQGAGTCGGEVGGLGEDGGGAEVEETAWRRLCAHAARHLVEGSERSRLSGAGAGVVDAD